MGIAIRPCTWAQANSPTSTPTFAIGTVAIAVKTLAPATTQVFQNVTPPAGPAWDLTVLTLPVKQEDVQVSGKHGQFAQVATVAVELGPLRERFRCSSQR